MADIEITQGTAGITVDADEEVTSEVVEDKATETATEDTQQTTEETTATNKEAETPPPSPTDEATEAFQQQMQDEKNLTEEMATKGLDFNEFAKEYEEKGGLSEESLKRLEEAGYPKVLVDSYISNLEYRSDMYANAVIGYAGGQEAFTNMQNFIKGQGADAVNSFNDAIKSGNLGVIKAVMNGFKAQMQSAYGTANPTLMGSNGANSTVATGYTDKQQMIEALSDKRYGKDKSYTKAVDEKIINSEGIF